MKSGFRLALALPAVWAAVAASAARGDVDAQPRAEPKSPAAQAAIAKAERAEHEARQAFNRAMVEVRRAQIAELKDAQKRALAANNVEEATAIATLVTQLQEDMDAYAGKTVRVKVVANKDWQTLVTLKPGTYRVRATGAWRPGHDPGWKLTGPLGYGDKGNLCRLGIRLGADPPTFYDEGMTLTVVADTPLALRMQDASHFDNEGQLTVTLTPK